MTAPIKAIVERTGGTASHSGSQVADRTLRDSLIDQLVGSALYNSPIHVGFGLFRRVMKCPLVKKDLLLHEVFYEHECQRILEDLPARQLDVILRQLINRGRPVHPSPWRRFKLRNGLI